MSSRGKSQWLRIRPPSEHFHELKQLVRKNSLHTVCEESHCPNVSECWSGGTATFMIMGDTCTRGCRFCAVKTTAKPPPLDPDEPRRLADAVAEMKLQYIVITSVDRDDLPDQGSLHFAECIRELKSIGILVEALIPDFRGDENLLKNVIDANPDVVSHNIETVKRLQPVARDRRANYEQSLKVLENVKKTGSRIFTKSSIMLGLGEREEEIIRTVKDLRNANADILTLGQYLQPSAGHLPVEEYVTPEKFDRLKKIAEETGFMCVASGPFVRSSYKAGEFFMKNKIQKNFLKLCEVS
ncbi:MAG: lipoyl synthase [Candidatus Aenigmarchaeota archaeon]|nr:lipoyl synthase [Candidatus Aenigmarchaeota archaeon]MDI6722027.1 lipoyl synthase [Candidatus Aenigmarchaeota archaeon]